MMHGPEKSDLAIVAGKPANKAEQSAAESVERRAGTKGNANQQSTHWTQSQARVSQALERIRQAFAVTHPRWEKLWGVAAGVVAPSSSMRTGGGTPWRKSMISAEVWPCLIRSRPWWWSSRWARRVG